MEMGKEDNSIIKFLWKDNEKYYFSEIQNGDLQEVTDIIFNSINNNLDLFFEKNKEQIKKSLEDKKKSWWKIFILKNKENEIIGTCFYLKEEKDKYNDFWWLHIKKDYLRKWLWNKLMTEVIKKAWEDWITELRFHTTRKMSFIKKKEVEKKKEEGEENKSPAIEMYDKMCGVEFVGWIKKEFWKIELESARYIINVTNYIDAQKNKDS